MRDFRFGFTLATHGSVAELTQTCRTAESYGYDVAVAVDHLGPGRASPFQSALAAAMVTERLRVGTFVLNINFWNPTVLAREVATAVRLTDGRLELGLGAGIVKAQFDAARIPWQGFDGRMDLLTSAVAELDELLAAEEDFTRPPLLLGGTSERALRLAADRADIVSFGGRFQVPGKPFGTLRLITAGEAAERMEFFTAAAGSRAEEIERNAFVIHVEVTDDREAAAARFAQEAPGELTAEEVMASPFALIGTEEEIAHQLVDARRRYGFSFFTVQRPHMAALGPSIKRARSLA